MERLSVNFSFFDAVSDNSSTVTEDLLHGLRREVSGVQLREIGNRLRGDFDRLDSVTQFNLTTRWRRAVISCYLSHLAILRDARAHNYSSYLVLEDDADAEVTGYQLRARLRDLHTHWPDWRLAYLVSKR